MAFLFGALLIPKDYFIIKEDVSIAVIINPIIMIMMLIAIRLRGKAQSAIDRDLAKRALA